MTTDDTSAFVMDLERRILAQVGKWSLAIIVSIVTASAIAASQWSSLLYRVHRLEQETNSLKNVNERLVRIEEQLSEALRRLRQKDAL